jgi:hypothetical protein
MVAEYDLLNLKIDLIPIYDPIFQHRAKVSLRAQYSNNPKCCMHALYG